MKRKEVEHRIFRAITDRFSEREARTIARWISEDWFRLQQEYDRRSEGRLLSQIIDRLKRGEPVQYILKQAQFFGLSLYVDPRVLIPRPETEELVEWLLEGEQHRKGQIVVWDIGTGSGCIGLSLKKHRPEWSIVLVDRSEEALQVSEENADRLGIEVEFVSWDVLHQPPPDELEQPDIIISNPPYVSEEEWKRLDHRVREHEPRIALVAENDPLVFFNSLLTLATSELREEGSLYVECHQGKIDEVEILFKESGLRKVERKKDLQGNWRMVRGMRSVRT